MQLGERERLLVAEALLDETSLAPDIEPPFACDVMVRYRGNGVPARVEAGATRGLVVRFDTPVAAVVPGQFAVFVRGERVLGGGVIRETVAAASEATNAETKSPATPSTPASAPEASA